MPLPWLGQTRWLRFGLYPDFKKAGLELFRTTTFRLTAHFAAAFAFLALFLFAFIYWQTAGVETRRMEYELEHDAAAIALESKSDLSEVVRLAVASRSHRIDYLALFSANGTLISGNLDRLSRDLPADGVAHRIEATSPGEDNLRHDVVLMVCRLLVDGRFLVIGRSLDSVDNLRSVVLHALGLGLAPAVLLALAAGVALSRQALEQVKAVRLTAERIVQGHLSERLPSRGRGDEFDRLADSMNYMLDEIERLLEETKNVTDNIAHDLRTPLTRVRSRLERARQTAQTHAELQEMVDRAIVALDQTLRIITALLRIGQIERGVRRPSFQAVDLQTVVGEIGDLFEPVAEEKEIEFTVRTEKVSLIPGDRDLLSELLANLVENALKFTPCGGRVRLTLETEAGSVAVRVIDNGPGIAPEEREAVLRRFYRSDKSRHIEGCGLGLSLVEAIAKLHAFRLHIGDAQPGCIFSLICMPERSQDS